MLLGTIVDKDGMICLQTSPRVWYPLEGNSGIAADFQETFNRASRTDIGRQLHRVGGVLQMEGIADAIRRRYREAGGEITQVCGGCDLERTREVLAVMKALPDDVKMRFSINWRIPHTLFNVASLYPQHFPMDRFNDPAARVDWFTIFEIRDLGKWSHGGSVYPQAF